MNEQTPLNSAAAGIGSLLADPKTQAAAGVAKEKLVQYLVVVGSLTR